MSRPIQIATVLLTLFVPFAAGQSSIPSGTGAWRTDPGWNDGKAEWALYDASRVIYGAPRAYEATIFTNTQTMSRRTTAKNDGARGADAVRVFKHNVSEVVPTGNYDYRFLTTSLVRTDDLGIYKVVASTQDDCGATYRQLVNDDGAVTTNEFCYFPGAGAANGSFRTPSAFSVHDALTLTLRDYPFGTSFMTAPTLDLVADLTSIRRVDMSPSTVTIDEVGDETISVPYGSVRTHHLRLHRADGARIADYWFAAEPDMRNVLVQYEDDAGTRYRLRRFAWWAYWAEPRPADAEATRSQ